MKISLTDFVDFVALTGGRKLSKVREIKERGAYHPKTDYYKGIREAIIALHSTNGGIEGIGNVVRGITDNSKKKNYQSIFSGYSKFLGRKNLEYFDPPRKEWSHNELNITLNPELGLIIKDKPHVIKLYFKKSKIEKEKVNSIICFLETELLQRCDESHLFTVLDVPSSKLHYKDKRGRDFMPLIYGEAESFAAMWKRV